MPRKVLAVANQNTNPVTEETLAEIRRRQANSPRSARMVSSR
jgi:hypothetical protein